MGPLEGDFAIMAGKSAFIINMLALHGLQAKVLTIKVIDITKNLSHRNNFHSNLLSIK
jgi:hypothetical protein